MIFESYKSVIDAVKKNVVEKDEIRFAKDARARFDKGLMLTHKIQGARIRDIKPGNFYIYDKDSSKHGNWKSVNDDKLTGNFSDPKPMVLWLGYITVKRTINRADRQFQYGVALNMNLVPPPLRFIMFNRMITLLSGIFKYNNGKAYGKWVYPSSIPMWKSWGIMPNDNPDLAKGLSVFCSRMGMPMPPPNLMLIDQDEIRNLQAIDWSELFNLYYLIDARNIKYGSRYKFNDYATNLFKRGGSPKIMLVN